MTAKILLFSDSKRERVIIQEMLSDYEVLEASCFFDAIEKIKTHSDIDIVLLDLAFADNSAFELLRLLEEMQRAEKLRLIILTEDKCLDKTAQALEAGANDYVRRPLTEEALKVRIDLQLEILRQKRLLAPKLEERNLLFKTIFEQAPIGIIISRSEKNSADVKDFISEINPEYEKIIGRSQEEYNKIGWPKITHPEDLAENLEKFEQLQTRQIDGYEVEKRYIRPDGSIIWVQLSSVAIKLEEGTSNEDLCLVQDITKRKEMEIALAESERSKAVLLSHLPGMAYRCKYDEDWTMEFVSDGCYELTGYKPESLLQNKEITFNDIIDSQYRESLCQQWEKTLPDKSVFRAEYEIITAEGNRKWVLEMGQGIYDEKGQVEALEGIIIDITKEKESVLKLKYVSEHDYLTGLYNRRFLQQLLAKKQTCENHIQRALLLINLNKIDSINLTFGYSFTEALVKNLAEKLSQFISHDKTLFRVSFKSFAFYVDGYKNITELKEFCNVLVKVLSEIQIMNIIGCGIGVAVIEPDDYDYDSILKNVLIASEKVIDDSRNFHYCFVDEALIAEINREKELKGLLMLIANDQDNDDLFLQYQPIFNTKTNKICGFEALVRLQNKKLGKVSPGEFITIAENMQMIVPIGLQILRKACCFLKQLETASFANISVAVNISAIQLFEPDFLEDCLQIIEETKINAENLFLEITESVFFNKFEDINNKLAQLRNSGIKVAIDDFGVGYSSFARVEELNIDHVKLDKYFMEKLLSLDHEKTIIGDIISMAHKLGYLVVAEGVEHEGQRKYLSAHNCDYLQGYLLSKPLGLEEAIKLLRKVNCGK
ncbi:MAG: EAL domain-containing protein [Acidaminococcaceae bacterium]